MPLLPGLKGFFWGERKRTSKNSQFFSLLTTILVNEAVCHYKLSYPEVFRSGVLDLGKDPKFPLEAPRENR